MEKIQTGNLNKQSDSDKRGWFIGHFIESDNLFKNNEFEVNWGVHSKNEKKSQATANKIAKTLSILIKGKLVLKFQEDNKEIVLAKVGDYVFWDANVFHTWEALEDSTTLTIRWPSIPHDQIPL